MASASAIALRDETTAVDAPMPSSVYVAGKFSCKNTVRLVTTEMVHRWGCTVPCPWYDMEQTHHSTRSAEEHKDIGKKEVSGVAKAELVVAFLTDAEYPYNGTFSEINDALGAKMLREQLGLPPSRVVIVTPTSLSEADFALLRIPHLAIVDKHIKIDDGADWHTAIPKIQDWFTTTKAFAPTEPLVVSVESPYSESNGQKLQVNIAYAVAAVKDAESRGEAPYASHLLHTQTLIGERGSSYISDHVKDNFGSSHEVCIKLTHAMRRRCDKIVLYVDLGESSGMRAAVDIAEKHGIPVERRHLPPRLMKEIKAAQSFQAEKRCRC